MAFFHLLLIDISIKIVLSHVVSFPTNLVSLNSESVCKSCGCFGKGCSGTTATRADVIFYYRSRAVLPLVAPKRYYRSGPRYYRWDQGGHNEKRNKPIIETERLGGRGKGSVRDDSALAFPKRTPS